MLSYKHCMTNPVFSDGHLVPGALETEIMQKKTTAHCQHKWKYNTLVMDYHPK